MEERMETRVQRWGNSLALRIPKPLADEAGLKDNSPVQLSLRDKLLVVVPIRKPALSLDSLLAQVTADNLHGEVQTGPAVGGETW
jgi:antitoxin MazE